MADSLDGEAGALLDSLLASLLDDFDHWFQRGEDFLARCPDAVMGLEERRRFADRLQQGRKAVVATRSLMKASSQPMAVSMEVMNPWHGLVTEVWALAARLGAHRDGQAPS